VTEEATTPSEEPKPVSRSHVAPGRKRTSRPTTPTRSRAPRSTPARSASVDNSASAARGASGDGATAIHPATLAIDIGGTGLKASVLGSDGRLLAERVRVATTYPCPPQKMIDMLADLVAPLRVADRCSVGFPGVVRNGLVRTAPHFVTKAGPGTAVVAELKDLWTSFDLATALSERLSLPTRVANDADLQGWAVISGVGLEMVVTLGTGVGSALFQEGHLAPHLELAHHRFRAHDTYNEQLGDAALHAIGRKKWRKRVMKAIENFEALVNYDRLYLGGGNARLMAGHIAESVTIVDNVAGLLGGIKLWEHSVHH
jgi:polyphosphate glucokinase